METIMDYIFKVLGYSIITVVAIMEIIAKLISLIMIIPAILVFMIVCPLFKIEQAPEFFQKWGQYMSESYLRSVKYLKTYYFG